ncbi:hypothetical protein D9M68_120910 [compost metagenome]
MRRYCLVGEPFGNTIKMVLLCATMAPLSGFAHSFATPYTLPVPFWMYVYGATAALILSFMVAAILANVRLRDPQPGGGRKQIGMPQSIVRILRVGSTATLGVAILCGFAGSKNPFLNLNMTLFWIGFVLALTYTVAVIGDVFSICNPWKVIFDWIDGSLRIAKKTNTYVWPDWLGCYPALALYIIFILIELFGQTTPYSLSVVLCIYNLINFVMARLLGSENWFKNGEFFGIFFNLVGKISPAKYKIDSSGAVVMEWRMPFSDLLSGERVHPSMTLFVLFMLASTAFDGAHETLPWSRLFWKYIYPFIDPLVKAHSDRPYAVAAVLYNRWQWIMLLMSLIIYYLFYVGFVWLGLVLSASPTGARKVGDSFVFTLVPIALAYHFTHYYTLLLSQGSQVVKLISDPLGVGWNLFGTASLGIQSYILSPNTIWHTQVGLILLGHIASVFLAHIRAQAIFGDTKGVLLSQVPMLGLMVVLTSSGLWILSLPISSG